jgi:hypothetical protein
METLQKKIYLLEKKYESIKEIQKLFITKVMREIGVDLTLDLLNECKKELNK